jgi:hypothetical protein
MFAFIGLLAGWIWQGLQAVADYALIALTAAYQFIRAGLGAVWDAARWSYTTILKPIGEFLHRQYLWARELYKAFVQPVIDWLHRLSDLLRRLYTTFVQPILSAIDGVQRILGLLELFHIQWAQDLDDALQRLEDKISKPLQLAIQFLNRIASRIESYVLTADNLFQRVTHLRTIQRDLNPVLNMQWGRLLGTLTDKQRAGPVGPSDFVSADEHIQLMEDVFYGNDDATGIDVESALALMERAAAGEDLAVA